MASFVQTDELNGTLTPTGAKGITKEGWGIDASLDGFIIQSATVTSSRSEDITQDQKGAQIGALDYDQRWDLTLDVIGNIASIASAEDASIGIDIGDTSFSWNGHKWKVTGVTYTGSFQDKKRYSITAYRTVNFPAST
jgi:hypothetical protein